MNNKRILGIIFLVLILVSALSFVSAEDNSYTIDHSFVDLTIGSNGLLHVKETLQYSFEGEFSGVYRDITIREGQNISNIQVSANGAFPVLKQEHQDGNEHLVIYLYSDSAHTKKIKDCDVDITLTYDFSNTVTLYNDIGLLQYNLWGKKWNDDVGGVDLKIHAPGDKNNSIYFTPDRLIKSDNVDGNLITATTDSISKDQVCGFVLLMPLDDFNNSIYAKHINESGKDKVLQSINDSQGKDNFWSNILLILGVIPFLSPIAAIFVYLRHGREPKVDYDGIYERELPTDDSPAVVNAIVDNKSDIGTPNMKGFEATILSLIDRKVFNLYSRENAETETHDLFIKFNVDLKEQLSDSEEIVFDILHNFADDENVLNLSTLNDQLSNEFNASWFTQQVETWQSYVLFEIDEKGVEPYFNNAGSSLMQGIGGIGFIIGIIIAGIGFFFGLDYGIFTLAAGIFLIIFSAILFAIPQDVFGHWTEKGRVFYLKWLNFKKFLEDNSLIKEHPPESIVIWKKYLIYGAALGVAENVYEAMKLQMPYDYDYDDDFFLYHSYGGYYMMSGMYNIGDNMGNSSSSDDSFDFGGFDDFGGGGFDGGGGGAF